MPTKLCITCGTPIPPDHSTVCEECFFFWDDFILNIDEHIKEDEKENKKGH